MLIRVALVVLFTTATASAEKVELVTMGVGSLMWERHGHIALCVTQNGLRDSIAHPASGDTCYNYGVADFHHPVAMGLGFVRGTHSFWVGKEQPGAMAMRYRATDRTIWVQPLPLDAAQTSKVIAKLEDDTLEAHRYYAYDHFDDNCTTRIRDIIDNATDHALSTMTDSPGDQTFRDYARDGFYGMRLPLVITDVVLGRSADRVPTYYERMFLPQYLRQAVQTKFGSEPYRLYERTQCVGNEDPSCIERGIPTADPRSGRWLFALVILLITAPVMVVRWWRPVAIGSYSVIGLALLGLAIITPLPYLRFNELLLVWFPFDLVVLFLPRKVLYARARLVMLAAIALFSLIGVLHQPLWAPMLWPLIPLTAIALEFPHVTRRAARARSKA